jgi:uncharacterized protein YecE (DUF72 family)
MSQVRVGTSGYQYDHWREIFYPQELPKKHWFPFYASRFDTVEINNTFYHLPQSSTFETWRAQAPAGFCFALKYSRFGSHLKHLKDPASHLQPFLGPILVQLPPQWRVAVDRLEQFLAAAPRRRQWAFEFRHPSWLCEPVYRILRRYKAALCIHDKLDHPRLLTANWTYLRYHGGSEEGGGYSAAFLKAQAAQIREYQAAGVDVFAYFNNDWQGHALRNAADLLRYMSNAARPARRRVRSGKSPRPAKRPAARSKARGAPRRRA